MCEKKLTDKELEMDAEVKKSMGALLGGLSNEQKDELKKILSEVDPEKDISVTNKEDKVLPDVTPTVDSNTLSENAKTSDIIKEAVYVESTIKIEEVGKMNSDADTTIEQSLIPSRPRNDSKIVPEKVITNPLTENRGGQQSEGDALNQVVQVAHEFFDPNSVGSAEGVYKREGGRVKHAAVDSMVTAKGVKEGGQLGKGFDPNSDIDRKNNPFKYLVTGFNVKLDNKSINVNQGFDEMDQAKAAVDENIFMILYEGKVRISKIIEGTPIIKDGSGRDLFVYNNSRWLSGK